MIGLWYVNVDRLYTQEVPLVSSAFRHTFLLYLNVGRGFLPSSYKNTPAEVLNSSDFLLHINDDISFIGLTDNKNQRGYVGR